MVRDYTYLELFLTNLNRQVNLNEFELHFNRPHQTIKNHLKQFTNAKILKEEKKRRFRFYALNNENPLTKEYLILCEKERLLNFLEKNTLFLRLYTELSKYFHDSKLLLFGSSTQKKEYEDIDLLIITKNNDVKSVINKFEQTYSKKIHAIITEEKELTPAFIREIKKTHIILNEHDYFLRLIYGSEMV